MPEHICPCHGRTFRRASSLGMHLYHERRKAEREDRAHEERREEMERVVARRNADRLRDRAHAMLEQDADRWCAPGELNAFRAGKNIGSRSERRRILAALDAALPALTVDGGACCDRRAAKVLAWIRKVVSGE